MNIVLSLYLSFFGLASDYFEKVAAKLFVENRVNDRIERRLKIAQVSQIDQVLLKVKCGDVVYFENG